MIALKCDAYIYINSMTGSGAQQTQVTGTICK